MLSELPCSSKSQAVDNRQLFSPVSDKMYYVNSLDSFSIENQNQDGGSGWGAALDFLAGSDLCGTLEAELHYSENYFFNL